MDDFDAFAAEPARGPEPRATSIYAPAPRTRYSLARDQRRNRCVKTHAKVILMRTATAWHAVRTSANMNENPRVEQYTWDADEATWRFYRQLFEELGMCDDG